MRFGKLNLIVCTEPLIYQAWKDGTEKLIAEKPVTRERAVEVISKLRFDAVVKLAAGIHK